jgi:hypothetical protein
MLDGRFWSLDWTGTRIKTKMRWLNGAVLALQCTIVARGQANPGYVLANLFEGGDGCAVDLPGVVTSIKVPRGCHPVCSTLLVVDLFPFVSAEK